MHDGDTAEEVLVGVMVAVVIAAVGTWLTGQLAAFMFMGAWPHVSLADALHSTFRLPGHLADPRGAWPAAVQGELPGTAAFYVAAMTALGILGFGTAAVVRWAARQVLGPVQQGSPAEGLQWPVPGSRWDLAAGAAGQPADEDDSALRLRACVL